jgi:rhodanese-related sulfurtransferase
MSISTISPLDLAELCKDGNNVDLIDVRTPMEFQELHAVPARNIPLDQLDASALTLSHNGSSEAPLYLICRSGSRGKQACEKLLNAGCTNVVNVEGGTLAWESAGLPVIRGEKVMSLERQVRIAAGVLVCLGALLSYLIHPAFIALSAFVGLGLIYAGVTDTCGMGLILARMPWNRGNKTTCGCKKIA